MRRGLVALLAGLIILIGLTGGVLLTTPQQAAAPALTVIAPTPGQVVNWWGDFDVSWTRVPDALFYRVQIFLPAGSEHEFIDYRFVPDTSRDLVRRDPRMKADAGLLQMAANHTIVVTAYGVSDALIAQYGAPDPLTGIKPYYPTYLTLDMYRQIGQPASVTFFVDP